MTNTLDYAPRVKWHRRRWLWCTVLVVVILGLVAVAAYFVWPTLRVRGRIWYLEHACLGHEEPPGTLVSKVVNDPTNGDTFYGCGPNLESQRFVDDMKVRHPSWWVGTLSGAYTHGRQCVAGERLIIVGMGVGNNAVWPNHHTAPIIGIIKPGGFLADAECVSGDVLYGPWYPPLRPGQTFSIYAGQSDPANAAVFILPYDIDGVRRAARFRLNAAGDKVELDSVVPAI